MTAERGCCLHAKKSFAHGSSGRNAIIAIPGRPQKNGSRRKAFDSFQFCCLLCCIKFVRRMIFNPISVLAAVIYTAIEAKSISDFLLFV